MAAILPGATIGILGGGQLGRMTAMAARSAGYNVHVLDPDPHCAASAIADQVVPGRFTDDVAAAYLARDCDVVTLEIEQIGLEAMRAAAKYAPVRPRDTVLEIVQDRARQKKWLADRGFPVGPYRVANTEAELAAAVRDLGSVFVKTTTGGYDGRGQAEVDPDGAAAEAWKALGGRSCVAERTLDLELEMSVLVARRPNGDAVCHPPSLNHHEDRILAWSVTPAPVVPKLALEAVELSRAIAEAIEVEGLLAIELFKTRDGQLLVNELAPRPHNSFHATERACATSQFEQLVRAVCDLPLGAPDVVQPAAIMNLLGDLWLGPTPPNVEGALGLRGVKLHLYGKRDARPGRKMGHLSAVGATPEEAVATVKEAMRRLTGSGERGAGSG